MNDAIFPIGFTKMSGTGNDFIIIDHRQACIGEADQAEFARRVCRRTFSIGADGLILIEPSDSADFSWRFYNSDGSVAAMCGNGARCAARFAYMNGIAGKTMSFATRAGIVSAEIQEDESLVKVQLTSPSPIKGGVKIPILDKELEVFSLDTGVPHAVIFTERLEEFPVVEFGRRIRFHPHFQPAGTNVNFVQMLPDQQLYVRTYERGVENETMACGTGAVASALVAALTQAVRSPVQIRTSGGEYLSVYFDEIQDSTAQKVFLQGPARTIFSGSMTAEAIQ